MRRRTLVVAAGGAAIAVFLALWLWPSGAGKGGKTAGPTTDRLSSHRAGTRTGAVDRRPASVSGRVTDDQGHAIAGAVISIAMRNLSRGERSAAGEAPEPVTATTGADGRWTTKDLNPGRYTVSAAARGHVPGLIDPLMLGPAETRQDVDFALARGGHTLSGQVSDIGGGPVAGALVRAVSVNDANIFHLFRAPFTAVTDRDGRYALTLGDASYGMEVAHLDYVGAQRFTAVRGADKVEDFTLTPGAVVQGQVRLRSSDEPVAGASVELGFGGGGDFDLGSFGTSATTDAEGRFTLRGLKSGTIELVASGPGYATREPTEVGVGIGEEVTGVVILVDRAYSVTGYVVDKRDKDRGIDGVLVAAYNFEGQVHMARDSTAEDGYFEIHGVQNGSYMIGAAGEERVVALMGQNVTVKDADLKDVIVELDAGATLSGRVEPPTTARIGLDVDPQSIGLGTIASAVGAIAATCRAQPDGTFSLRGVPAGTFTLVAHGDDGSEGRVPVTVADADQGGLVVKLDPRASIAGVVVDAAGRPVSGVGVNASPQKGGSGILTYMSKLWGNGRGETRADGSFEVRGLASGTQEVSVEDHNGHDLALVEEGGRRGKDATTKKLVEIKGTEPVTGLRLVVETRDKVLRGLVVGPDGSPVADAWVTARARGALPSWAKRRKDAEKERAKPEQPAGQEKQGTHSVSITIGSNGSEVDSENDEDPGDSAEQERRRRRWAPAEPPVLTGADGRFEIRGLGDSRYDLEAEGLKGTARGTTEDVAAGGDVTIRLQTLAGIRGVVTRAGQPVSAYTITASGPMKRESHVVDPTGEYRLGRLEPGTYKLSVLAPEGRSSAEVKVTASDVAHRDLVLIPYGSVRGVLVDALSGEPMANMPVFAFSDEGTDMGSMAMSALTGDGPRTDADGRFRVGRLGQGKGSLVALDGDKTQFAIAAQSRFTLAAGQDLDLGTLQGHRGDSVPRDQQGDLGLTVTSETWSARPRAPGVEVGEPPSGVDAAAEQLWVEAVATGGPAAAAGVKVGDRIEAINGVPVAEVGPGLAESMLRPRQVRLGQAVTVVIVRDGKQNSVSITPRPPPP